MHLSSRSAGATPRVRGPGPQTQEVHMHTVPGPMSQMQMAPEHAMPCQVPTSASIGMPGPAQKLCRKFLRKKNRIFENPVRSEYCLLTSSQDGASTGKLFLQIIPA